MQRNIVWCGGLLAALVAAVPLVAAAQPIDRLAGMEGLAAPAGRHAAGERIPCGSLAAMPSALEDVRRDLAALRTHEDVWQGERVRVPLRAWDSEHPAPAHAASGIQWDRLTSGELDWMISIVALAAVALTYLLVTRGPLV